MSVLLRLRATAPFPTFVGACQRLRASGLEVTARDWFCLPTPLSARAAYAGALLLVAVGLVVPCAILAATGRRWSSLWPLASAPFVNVPVFPTSWWDATSHGGNVLVATNAVLLAAPVVAIWSVTLPRGHRGRRPHLVAALVAGAGCLLGSLAVWLWAGRMVANHWAAVDIGTGVRYLVPAAFSVAIFGAMLGIDRRWWPWSLVPVALLLSMAPCAALVWSPEARIDWSFFGGEAPLVALGLIWSMWRPASLWLSSRLHRLGDSAPHPASQGSEDAPAPGGPLPRRASLELNAGAAALLVLSIAMFRADPLPIQEGINLPTYLGERVQAQDVRTKLDLRQAMAVMDVYAGTEGTYRGFDANAGRRLDASLAWSDGHLASDGSGAVPALTMSIEDANRRMARIAARSDSGAVFCMERTHGGSIRYGSAAGAGEGDPSAFAGAVTRCGSTPWSHAATGMLDPVGMCDEVDASGGYLICRMVQVLITDTMRRTRPV